MFSKFKLPFSLSFMEVISIFSFSSIAYFFIFKYFFYYSLGIPWYLYTVNLNQIIITSVKLIVAISVSALISTVLYNYINNFKIKIRIYCYAFMISLMYFGIAYYYFYRPIFSFGEGFFKYIDIPLFSMIAIYIIIIMGVLLIREFKSKEIVLDKIYVEEHVLRKNFSKIIHLNKIKVGEIVLLIITCIFAPAIGGSSEALLILRNIENQLSEVEIKDNLGEKEKWYLLDYLGDKYLLMSKDPNNKKLRYYRIVEYKDIIKISSKVDYEDEDVFYEKFIELRKSFLKS